MDLTKIVSKTLAEMDEEYESLQGFSFDASNPSNSKSYILLRDYSEKLLKNYHKELSCELRKHGIEL